MLRFTPYNADHSLARVLPVHIRHQIAFIALGVGGNCFEDSVVEPYLTGVLCCALRLSRHGVGSDEVFR